MRIIAIFLLFFASFLYSEDNLKNKTLIELFKGKYYSYICLHRWIYINKYQKKNEKFLSLVAYACLKKNYLTPALDLAKVLRITKSGRINATYINTLFLIKLLLERYIKDNYKIEKIKIPLIEDNLLAKVFYMAQIQKPQVSDNTFEVSDNKYTYKVTFKEDVNNIVIKVYKNNKFIKKVKFW
ncbi:hypothetical protein JCM11957_07860 [Caminibacter profundus]